MATTTIDRETARDLLGTWEAQQSALVAVREERFEVMLWTLAQKLEDERRDPTGDDLVVLDVACGPGSISKRVLNRFPGARVVAIDLDSSLLSIAQSAIGESERFSVVEADLAGAWQHSMPSNFIGRADAALSATALHWLMPADLVSFYTILGEVLRPNGIYLNADHLRYDAVTRPGLARLAERHDAQTQHVAYSSGAVTWESWWEAAARVDALAPLIANRESLFVRGRQLLYASTDFHLAALTTAGFSESGVLSQHLDNLLIYGRR